MLALGGNSSLSSRGSAMRRDTRFVALTSEANALLTFFAKVLQRIYKYGGQPFVRDYLAANHGSTFDNAFGKGTGKAIMNATAGSIIGVGEIVLLPLDVLKIKRQTNPEAFRGRGLFKIVKDEGFGLYRGWGWTAARNAPGSFAVRSLHNRSPGLKLIIL